MVGDLKPRGGSHHDPGQLLRQMQLINNKQRHINDIEAVRSHISVQIMNNSSKRRAGYAVVVLPAYRSPLFGSLRMEGRKNHTIAPHTTKATAALRYITVKPKPIASAYERAGANHHASDTCARSILS